MKNILTVSQHPESSNVFYNNLKYKQFCFRRPQKRAYLVHYLSRDAVTKYLMGSLTRLRNFTAMILFLFSTHLNVCPDWVSVLYKEKAMHVNRVCPGQLYEFHKKIQYLELLQCFIIYIRTYKATFHIRHLKFCLNFLSQHVRKKIGLEIFHNNY
jgi:hypothetical protein